MSERIAELWQSADLIGLYVECASFQRMIIGPESADKQKGYKIQYLIRTHIITNLRVDLHILLGGKHVLLSLLNAIVEHILKDVDRLMFAHK